VGISKGQKDLKLIPFFYLILKPKKAGYPL